MSECEKYGHDFIAWNSTVKCWKCNLVDLIRQDQITGANVKCPTCNTYSTKYNMLYNVWKCYPCKRTFLHKNTPYYSRTEITGTTFPTFDESPFGPPSEVPYRYSLPIVKITLDKTTHFKYI